MQRFILACAVILALASCDNTKGGGDKNFKVSGVLHNNSSKMIFLEKVPASMTQPTIEDSAEISKDGKFELHGQADESVIFNLRLGEAMNPVATVINDAKEVTLDIKLDKTNNKFSENYKVEGSPASEHLRAFFTKANTELVKAFGITQQLDSLSRQGAADSVLAPLVNALQQNGKELHAYALENIKSANDPALVLFELGFYQSTANSSPYGLPAISNDDVSSIINATAQKFPSHQAIAAIKASIDNQRQREAMSSWVGKEAPDFTLPDVNGKEIKLSSFRGKYVLVDFWASWCGPCRQENPAVVSAFNKYRTKNFTVLGVSLDKPGQKDKWIKAIKDDKLLWTQVSDLQEWASPVVAAYQIDGIPFNVLVDPQGKVIAQGLRGSGLEAKLAELLP